MCVLKDSPSHVSGCCVSPLVDDCAPYAQENRTYFLGSKTLRGTAVDADGGVWLALHVGSQKGRALTPGLLMKLLP